MLRNAPISWVGAALLAVVIPALLVAQATPNLSGNWAMDPAKSELADGRVLTLTIEQSAAKIKVDGVSKDKAGVEAQLHFVCGTNGATCDFDDAGHKSKVALWYNGAELIACKTEGPAGDAVNEWHMKLSADGKTLNVDVEHVDPTGKAETMVFTKK